jgi:hypothetical protein
MAELGQTRDPKPPVPGDVRRVGTTAASLGKFGDVLIRAGNGLRDIDDGGWTGTAADGFHRFFDNEPTRWFTCSDCFRSARDALDRYNETLQWTQGEAKQAIDLVGARGSR